MHPAIAALIEKRKQAETIESSADKITERQFCNKEVSEYIDSRLQAASFILWLKNPQIPRDTWQQLHNWLVPAQMSNGYSDTNLEEAIWKYFTATRPEDLKAITSTAQLVHVTHIISLYSPPKTAKRILKWISES